MALTPGNKKKEDIETMINIAKRASRRFHDKKQSLGSANLLEMFDKRLNLLIQEKGEDQMILPHETSVTDKYKCECPVCQRKTKVRP